MNLITIKSDADLTNLMLGDDQMMSNVLNLAPTAIMAHKRLVIINFCHRFIRYLKKHV